MPLEAEANYRSSDRVCVRRQRRGRIAGAAIGGLLLATLLAAVRVGAQQVPVEAGELSVEAREQAFEALQPRYAGWVRSVLGLITQAELDYFLRLSEDFRRDSFMEAFWVPRDPDPSTPGNELRERWEQLGGVSGEPPRHDARYILLLLNGPPGGWSLPDGRSVARCYSKTTELEIWFYGDGVSGRSPRRFPVILLRRSSSGPYEVYQLGSDLRATQRVGGLPTTEIRLLCADELLRYTLNEIARDAGYGRVVAAALSPPLPPPEWLAAFRAAATDLPPGAAVFPLQATLRYPSRKGSRTAVEVLLPVARSDAPGRRFDGALFHAFDLTGEVIRDGQLFDSFRYRFEGPTDEGVSEIPLGFTRFLRGGSASLRVLVHDVYDDRWARLEEELVVPAAEGLPGAASDQQPKPAPALQLLPPAGELLSGRVRFHARAGRDFDRVTFYLDDRPVLSKGSPPFSVELDLGDVPEAHRVRVVGLAGGQEVATDQIWLNQGASRFRVRLVEPRVGGIYPGSTTVRAEVEVPGGGALERLDVLVDDSVVATLTEPPLAASVRLEGSGPAVVRAVAYLADGSTAEDAVLVNSSSWVESVAVRLVEVPVLVLDRDGRPLRDLSADRFHLFDEGEERSITRFRPVTEGALRTALVIDRSVSMAAQLPVVVRAAGRFATAALGGPEDRLAVFSFADRLLAEAAFTGSLSEIERALAGIAAGGRTALHDSLMQVLASFEGSPGGQAVLVFTDGLDEVSEASFDQLREMVRHRGVAIYLLGPEGSFPDPRDRRRLEQLASESGGRALFLADLADLAAAYEQVLGELRSRYLLTFELPDDLVDGGERRLRVEVEVPGARAVARAQYRPD